MSEPQKSALQRLRDAIQGKTRGDSKKRILDRLGALQSGPRVIGGLDFWMAKQTAQKESIGS